MEKPVETFRAGGVSASVFMNQRQVGTRKVKIPSVSFQKTYLENEEWKTTSSLNADDLPKAVLVLSQAYAYVQTQGPGKFQAEEPGEEIL